MDLQQREELQKKGHHDIYGDINYPKGIWFKEEELESFEFTGYGIFLPDFGAVFDIYKSYPEAVEAYRSIFKVEGIHSNKHSELWSLYKSQKVEKLDSWEGVKHGQS